jgi:hypothetical protein
MDFWYLLEAVLVSTFLHDLSYPGTRVPIDYTDSTGTHGWPKKACLKGTKTYKDTDNFLVTVDA